MGAKEYDHVEAIGTSLFSPGDGGFRHRHLHLQPCVRRPRPQGRGPADHGQGLRRSGGPGLRIRVQQDPGCGELRRRRFLLHRRTPLGKDHFPVTGFRPGKQRGGVFGGFPERNPRRFGLDHRLLQR